MNSAHDRDMLIQVRRGSDAAARLLWERHGGRMTAVAAGLLGDRAAADDAVQQALLHLLQADSRTISRVEDVTAWLAALTRNAARNLVRSERRRATHTGTAAANASNAADGHGAGGGSELYAVLEPLPEEQREVVVLKHAGGLTFDQIALALSEPRGTVASRYRLGLEALRARLGSAGSQVRSEEGAVQR